jgi:uncharacterized membrane protein YeaQ/YmgE (transglycosylase-associated protein family)
MLSLCSWLVFGFLAGLFARAIMPGEQRMGLLKTSLLGIAGSFVGGVLAAVVMGWNPMVFRPSGFIGSVLGALVLLIIGRATAGR